MTEDKLSVFIESTYSSIRDSSFHKIIFHKPIRSRFLKSMITVYSDEKKSRHLKISNFTKTQDITETFLESDLKQIITSKLSEYSFADLFTTQFELLYKKSNKNISTLVKKVKKKTEKEDPVQKDHNNQKNYIIPASEGFLYDLGITDKNGIVKPSMYHKFRQINRFIEIINHHVVLSGNKPVIADMGSGKGYLTFALYTYLVQNSHSEPTITGVDLRPDLIETSNKIAAKYNLSGISFLASDIAEISFHQLDMLIALHACDTATDLAIQKGIMAKAKYIILSPCCHKQIRKEIRIKNEMTQYGIFEERMAEMLTDTIRTLIMNHFGYKTKIIEYISSEHTSKNTMIIAEYTKKPENTALDKINLLKKQYGINTHFLEQLLQL